MRKTAAGYRGSPAAFNKTKSKGGARDGTEESSEEDDRKEDHEDRKEEVVELSSSGA